MTQWQDFVTCAMMEVHVGCLVQRSQRWILTDPRNVWGQASLRGPALSLKNLAMGCRNLLLPQIHRSTSILPPTKKGSFKAIGPEFWRENWAMKCPPKLRKLSNLDEGTWYNSSHEASLLAKLCFDCTVPNKSNNSQNSRWSWHSSWSCILLIVFLSCLQVWQRTGF